MISYSDFATQFKPLLHEHRVLLQSRAKLYNDELLNSVVPFWQRYGIDEIHGGYLTALNRDGSLLDGDKSIWFQGRGAWMFASLNNQVNVSKEWLAAARSGIDFLRRHAASPSGKLYFTVTRQGAPLRLRRYFFSEAFAAIAEAAYYQASGEEQAKQRAVKFLASYLLGIRADDPAQAKVDPQVRPQIGLAPWMICIVTAQELRRVLGEAIVLEQTLTGWVDTAIEQITSHFMNDQQQALLEVVSPNGDIIDHFDGRQLNPGHALECAWFILWEGLLRNNHRYRQIGCTILDWMWERGWDRQYGGIFYFRDLYDLPVQDYWHDMKFWWPHCEAIIATLLAWLSTGEDRYRQWYEQVHQWTFSHFPDPEYGEWFGYLHRDGTLSVPLKGNTWKGPFHIPRMLLFCSSVIDSALSSVPVVDKQR